MNKNVDYFRPVGSGEWSEESVSQFASLAHCALWKVVWAKVVLMANYWQQLILNSC